MTPTPCDAPAASRLPPEDQPVPTPEEYIGQTIESDGVARRVDSIRAIGSQFQPRGCSLQQGRGSPDQERAHPRLESFDRAVSLAPQDLWNRIQRAACLARLDRDRECLGDLRVASEQGGRPLRSCRVQVPEHGLGIRECMERLASAEPSNREVRRVLRKHLGLSLLVHLTLHGLRSRIFRHSP